LPTAKKKIFLLFLGREVCQAPKKGNKKGKRKKEKKIIKKGKVVAP